MTEWPPRFARRPVVLQAIPLASHGLAQIVVLRQYADRPQYRFTGHPAAEEKFREMPEAERASFDIVWGPLRYGIQEAMPGYGRGARIPFLTMLRDPVERVIAHYYFVLSAPTHYLYRRITAANWTLHDYIANEATIELDNDQVRCLNAVPHRQIPFGKVTRAMLDEARRALDHPDTIFGLTEYFDETLLIYARAMGWEDVRYLGRGMRSQTPQAPQVPAETLDLIRRTNALDIELYEHARAVFEERLRGHGAAFQEELRQYREANDALLNNPNWSNQLGEIAPAAVPTVHGEQAEAPAAAETGAHAGSGSTTRDIYWLASYPRSGNTWLRFLLDSYFFPPARYMQEVGRLSGELDWWLAEARRLGHNVEWIPGALRQAQAKYARPEGYPHELFFKTHFVNTPSHPLIRRTRAAVHLLRNPRDVLLSGMNFSELTGRGEGEVTDAHEAERRYSKQFIEARGDASWLASGYGTWAQNARSWMEGGEARGFPVLTVRYEDLKAEPEANLARILEFLSIPVDRHRLQAAIEHCSLARLRNLEISSRAMTDIAALRKSGRYFFNKGLSGQSLAGLGAEVEAAFERAFGEDAAALGYG